MQEYPNGTGTRLKICRLNCLRVQIPSPVPVSPLEMIHSGWFIDYDYGDENLV